MQSTDGSSLYNPTLRFFLVRHAERLNDSREDPPLTAEGRKSKGFGLYAARCRDYRNHHLTMDMRQRHRASLSRPAEDYSQVIPTADPPRGYFQARPMPYGDLKMMQF